MKDNDDSKGAYNRAHIFKGKNYACQKENIYVHLLLVDKKNIVVIIYGPFICKGKGDVVKHPKDWTNN